MIDARTFGFHISRHWKLEGRSVARSGGEKLDPVNRRGTRIAKKTTSEAKYGSDQKEIIHLSFLIFHLPSSAVITLGMRWQMKTCQMRNGKSLSVLAS